MAEVSELGDFWSAEAVGVSTSGLRGLRSAAARSPLGTCERSEELAPAARGARPLGRELPKANGPAGRGPKGCFFVVTVI